MDEKKPLNKSPGEGYPGGTTVATYTGYPQGGQQAGTYPGAQPPAGTYPGTQPLAGAYPGYQGGYQGGQPAGGYPHGGQPEGSYPGAPFPAGQGYQHGGVAQGDIQVQWNGEVPAEDVIDNPNVPMQVPTAPPLEKMDQVTGYTNVGFNDQMLQPPSYEEAMRGEQPIRSTVTSLPTVSEEDCRAALLQHVAEHCCYGKGAAQEMKIADIQHSSAFHYTLETFGEGRASSWAYEPYRGQPIDGPMNGPAPGPWDIQMNAPAMFSNTRQFLEVPHTASVKPCHACLAMGKIRCHRCFGRGRVRCDFCHGRGYREVFRHGEHEHERCTWCHGDGRKRCMTCSGWGMITCVTCQGHCNLKCFIKLTITWTNHLVDHIVERTSMPDHLIRNVSGQLAFEEQNLRVWPVNHFPDSEINSASQRLVSQQAIAYPNEKILMQRHRVRIVPVAQVLYKWKDHNSSFFVFGFEHKVHAPDYPQQCCCGCSIV
ncbi:hypothetical protein CHS0354_027440 [Potamilus streckersoni]|uniref:Protein SSUH2 homolog n=1 Tax=Potamilus streckersoni TaxID=2493646 RepID=A0AAE0S311_9BIVA|nr:hypothetical protein CHS0354_027440 [Potamilus streckersoni]